MATEHLIAAGRFSNWKSADIFCQREQVDRLITYGFLCFGFEDIDRFWFNNGFFSTLNDLELGRSASGFHCEGIYVLHAFRIFLHQPHSWCAYKYIMAFSINAPFCMNVLSYAGLYAYTEGGFQQYRRERTSFCSMRRDRKPPLGKIGDAVKANPDCGYCDGEGWVCENHPTIPLGRCGGAIRM